ncbi:MAG: J domain-containing protein [Terracidiphilus sp.]|jgi:DnaJ-domain-containing protein 1
MEGQFQVDRGSCSSMREGYEAIPAVEPNRPELGWQFVTDMEQVLGGGSEPDPLFFVQSWTLGVPAAVESFHQRKQSQKGRERRGNSFQDFASLATLTFAQQSELTAEYHSSSRFGIAESYGADWQTQPAEEPAAWSEDRAPRDWKRFAAECDSSLDTLHPMTQRGACRLLGVTETSTREQIKAAYRRMASRCHPDRLEGKTAEERQLATEEMAAINEAYRLLGNGPQ